MRTALEPWDLIALFLNELLKPLDLIAFKIKHSQTICLKQVRVKKMRIFTLEKGYRHTRTHTYGLPYMKTVY